jgi:hypothetical protein
MKQCFIHFEALTWQKLYISFNSYYIMLDSSYADLCTLSENKKVEFLHKYWKKNWILDQRKILYLFLNFVCIKYYPGNNNDSYIWSVFTFVMLACIKVYLLGLKMFPGHTNLVEMKSTQFQISNIYEQHINYTGFSSLMKLQLWLN